MKKFLLNFIIIFVVVLVILNSRYVFAEIKFAVKKPANSGNVETVAKNETGTNLLPISKARIEGYLLEIPGLGIKAPIVLEGSTDTGIILKRLEDGIVHYSTSPLPGENGASLILGHSSAYPWYKGKYGSVFALLGKLKTGEVIKVYHDDKVFEYKVSGSLVFNPLSKDPEINKLEETEGSSIILISCWPVGTNYRRIAVRADLVR